MVYSDRLEQKFSMKPSELKISILVESYGENTTENYRYFHLPKSA